MLLTTVALMMWLGSATAAQWPACIQTGFDYDGPDVISGYRFSNDGCALWCQEIGANCVRWVYHENGTQCHIKAAPGNMVAVNGSTTFTSFSGLPNCFSVNPVPWPDCSVMGKAINGSNYPNSTKGTGYYLADKESCSTACQLDANCTYWVFSEGSKNCFLKVGSVIATVSQTGSWYGPNTCFGKVTESVSGGSPIDGNWSPWSTLATPCIDKNTGKKVDCGGGIQIRYRSCTDPQPRFGGNVCPGDDQDEYPCNTLSCTLPEPFLWSEYGRPDKTCTNGTRTRTTLCGTLRRRLPPPPGTSVNAPAVYWPTCMTPYNNTATTPLSVTTTNLTACSAGCQANAVCLFWTFNFDDSSCRFNNILNVDQSLEMANFVTGEKSCSGTLAAPYCGLYQQNYAGAAAVVSAQPVDTYYDCAANCTQNPKCLNWYLTIATDGTKTCELRDAVPAAATPTLANGTSGWTFFGSKACAAVQAAPTTPEDAEELGYREVCMGNQYRSESVTNNTWDINYCPSPCDDNGDCPKYAACYDTSDAAEPQHSCVCMMGKVMVGGQCVNPPASTPAPRVDPTLMPNLESFAKGITRTSYFFIIVFTVLTLAVFAYFRILNPGRFIHMNIELALLLAHLCMVPDFSGGQHTTLCRNISICIHFFYTAAFAFYVMEGVYAYSCVSYAVRKDGVLSNMANFMAGWGMAIIVIAFTVSFEYDSYGGVYHCFLQMNTGLIYGELLPHILLCIVAIMLVEAGNNVDKATMEPLEGTDEDCLTSARYMLGTLFLRVVLTFLCFITGAVAFYEQNLGVYLVFSVLTGVLGVTIFVSHCTANEKIRAMLKSVKEKFCGCCGKKKKDEDAEPIMEKDYNDEDNDAA